MEKGPIGLAVGPTVARRTGSGSIVHRALLSATSQWHDVIYSAARATAVCARVAAKNLRPRLGFS